MSRENVHLKYHPWEQSCLHCDWGWVDVCPIESQWPKNLQVYERACSFLPIFVLWWKCHRSLHEWNGRHLEWRSVKCTKCKGDFWGKKEWWHCRQWSEGCQAHHVHGLNMHEHRDMWNRQAVQGRTWWKWKVGRIRCNIRFYTNMTVSRWNDFVLWMWLHCNIGWLSNYVR